MQPNVRQDKILDIFYDFFSKKKLSCALLVAARVGSVNSGGPMIAHTKKFVFSCAETGNVVFKKKQFRPVHHYRNSGYGLRLVTDQPADE